MNESLKKRVIERLSHHFGHRPVDLARVMFYLTKELEVNWYSALTPPAWSMLAEVMDRPAAFKQYAEYLCEDTKKAQKNEEFVADMNTVYGMMLRSSSSRPAANEHSRTRPNIFVSLLKYASMATCDQLRSTLPSATSSLVASSNALVTYSHKMLIRLSAVQLGVTALGSIIQWFRGEISGVLCAKNIVDATFTVAGGVAGGIGGGLIGALFGPIGIIIGATVGGTIGAELAGRISNALTNKLFGLAKDVSVEEAYRTLGVRCNASNDQINQALRALRLQHHPDKGGDPAMFMKVESAMAIIKLHRGETN